MIIIIAVIVGISFGFALRSMKDLGFSQELEKAIKKGKMKGTIVFFKNKIVHYSSESSSS